MAEVAQTFLANPYQQQSDLAQRQKLAEILQSQAFQPEQKFSYAGIEAPPSAAGAIAKALQGGIGAYLQGSAMKEGRDRRDQYSADMAKVLEGANAKPWVNPDTGEAQGTAGGLEGMLAALKGVNNPDLSPMMANLTMQDLARKEARADKADERSFTMSRDRAQNDFTAAQGELSRAHSAFLQDKSAENQAALQKAQQGFAAAQQAAQQAFTAGQNQLTREQQAALKSQEIAANAPGRQQQARINDLKIKEEQKKLEDADRSKTEAVVSTDRMIRSIDEIANHPGLSGAVGAGIGLRFIPGTDAASFDTRLETLKSQAFLPMVAQLKGMGQLSDAEGKKLTAAIGALDTKMSEKEFKASLAEIKGDLEAARKRMGAPPESLAPKPAAAYSDVDKAAIEWANKNPTDPRSAAIKQRLGM